MLFEDSLSVVPVDRFKRLELQGVLRAPCILLL